MPDVPQWRPVSRYPSSDLDLAFVAPDGLTAAAVEEAITQAAGDVLAELALFDVYRGAGIDDGTRSLAYRLRLQALDRTLTDADVADVRGRVVAAATGLGATLRG
jgi:phenylalanyl-tRNA synthetase beta chain